jgi:hypothetical protein
MVNGRQSSSARAPVLDPVTINKPNVNQPWTSYRDRVTVQPGDIVTVTDAGGCVQTGGHGLTWKQYVTPDAPDAPNLYHGLIAITPIMSNQPGNPPSGKRIQDIINQPISVPFNAANPELWLGYEDTDYSDNGYWGHDPGTDNKCANYEGAWVTIKIQRN